MNEPETEEQSVTHILPAGVAVASISALYTETTLRVIAERPRNAEWAWDSQGLAATHQSIWHRWAWGLWPRAPSSASWGVGIKGGARSALRGKVITRTYRWSLHATWKCLLGWTALWLSLAGASCFSASLLILVPLFSWYFMELLGHADKGSSENMFVSMSRGSFSFCLQGAFARMFVRLRKFDALTLQDFSVRGFIATAFCCHSSLVPFCPKFAYYSERLRP